MASTLIGGRAKDRVVDSGHGTSALGPSDTSDTGSDIAGAPDAIEGDVIDVQHVTSEDMNTRANSDVLPDHIETVIDLEPDEGEPDR